MLTAGSDCHLVGALLPKRVGDGVVTVSSRELGCGGHDGRRATGRCVGSNVLQLAACSSPIVQVRGKGHGVDVVRSSIVEGNFNGVDVREAVRAHERSSNGLGGGVNGNVIGGGSGEAQLKVASGRVVDSDRLGGGGRSHNVAVGAG